ncbi:MAG: hypothetical protein M3Q81_04315 [bacterium]|nr:hypothetical protein [bacterium]
MIQTQVTRTVNTQEIPGATVQQENVTTSNQIDTQDYTLLKVNQVIWFFAHLIAGLLALRFVFLLLGANMTGIVLFIYNISSIFVLPFRGIFPAPTTGEFYMDTAALLGIALYYLLAFLLVRGLALFSRSAEI